MNQREFGLDEYIAELKNVKTLDREEELLLWQAYKDTGNHTARQKLIRSYQPLVFKCALPWRNFSEVMDVVQEGTIGLIEAVENYDYRRGVAFSLFAIHRIRGKMLDFWQQEKKSGCLTLDAAIIDSTPEIELIADTSPSLSEQVFERELISRLHEALKRLPAKEQTILRSVYFAGAAASEVAGLLQLSQSHIYRLQKTGIRRIRGMLSRFMKKF